MKKIAKLASICSLAAAGVAMVACGGDSGSSSYDMEESFDIVLKRSAYSYNYKDSTLSVAAPVCEVATLGNLEWKEETKNPTKSVAYLKKNTAIVERKGKEPLKYDFDGSRFPVGVWSKEGEAKKKIRNASRYTKGGTVESVFHYEGKCFAQDMKANLLDKNSALKEFDSVMTSFYLRFKPASDRDLDVDEMMKNIRVADCDELTLYGDLISIKVKDFDSNSGTIAVGYDGDDCKVKFTMRYADDKDDCNAAYEDFLSDKAAKEFSFDKYSRTVEYDEYCIEQLILDMKRDQKIPLKKETEPVSTKGFARSFVDLLVSALTE